jgi:small conductance mechanosensitive channel
MFEDLPAQIDGQLQRTVRLDEAMVVNIVGHLGDLSVNLVAAALILAVTFWAAGWISRAVRSGLGRIHRDKPDQTLQGFAGSLARYLVIIVGLVAVLQQLGVQTTSILAVLGAAGLAVGLALQGALSNVAAGVMILLFRPYRVGDFVEIGARKGTVRSLDLFFTELATPDNIRIIAPNGKVMGDVILNYTSHARRRVDAIVKLPYAADVGRITTALKARLDSDPRVRKEPAPMIEVIAVSFDHVEIAARAWTAREDEPYVKAELMLAARLLADSADVILPPMAPTRVNSKAVEPPSHGLPLLRRVRRKKA